MSDLFRDLVLCRADIANMEGEYHMKVRFVLAAVGLAAAVLFSGMSAGAADAQSAAPHVARKVGVSIQGRGQAILCSVGASAVRNGRDGYTGAASVACSAPVDIIQLSYNWFDVTANRPINSGSKTCAENKIACGAGTTLDSRHQVRFTVCEAVHKAGFTSGSACATVEP